MGLEITKSESMTKWEIPLIGFGDNNWEDNSWMVEHLRALADKIEKDNPRIINIGLRSDCQNKIPQLYVELYEK